MTDNLTLNMDAYLPLRDVVLTHFVRQFKGRAQAGRETYGAAACVKAWSQPYTYT